MIFKDHLTAAQGRALIFAQAAREFLHEDFKLKVTPAVVREGSWIAAASFIGPGVEKLARGLSWRREVYFIKMLRQIFWFAGTPAAAIREITCDQRARFTHDASPT